MLLLLLLFLLFLLFFFSVFVFSIFFSSRNVTPLMETSLNSGLSFIKHVDCGRGVSKEAHKVLIEKTKKIVDFYCWLRKWELCYLESMEKQMVAFATEDDFFVNLFLCQAGLHALKRFRENIDGIVITPAKSCLLNYLPFSNQSKKTECVSILVSLV